MAMIRLGLAAIGLAGIVCEAGLGVRSDMWGILRWG